MAPRLLTANGEPATFAELADSAGVSAPTLRHYFGDRVGAYVAALAAVNSDGERFFAGASDIGDRAPDETLPALLLATVEAWRRYGLGAVFSPALALGIGHDKRGPAFLSHLLEPFLESVERLLQAHVDRGELPVDLDVRGAALGLLAPPLLVLLHQDALGGHTQRPLDVETFARTHAQTMLTGLLERGSRAGRTPNSERMSSEALLTQE
jgi:AcrR family transcriptional regulator